jgi:hypothetical protein
MDDRLTKALEFSHFRTASNLMKEKLKLRLENLLTYSENGGTFKVTPELISFVDVLIRKGLTEAVLLDSRENPVMIKDLATFSDTLVSQYVESTNEYLIEFDKLKKARSVSQATGIAKP